MTMYTIQYCDHTVALYTEGIEKRLLIYDLNSNSQVVEDIEVNSLSEALENTYRYSPKLHHRFNVNDFREFNESVSVVPLSNQPESNFWERLFKFFWRFLIGFKNLS